MKNLNHLIFFGVWLIINAMLLQSYPPDPVFIVTFGVNLVVFAIIYFYSLD